MSGRIGTNNMYDVYLQSTLIDSVYLGTSKVYDIDDKFHYAVKVNAGQNFVLAEGLRDRTVAKTDWGDGTIDNKYYHVYQTAGNYTIKSRYAIGNGYYYSWGSAQSITNIIKLSNKITDFSGVGHYCSNAIFNIQAHATTLQRAVNMHNAFLWCENITGSPVCGPNVTDMGEAYYQCANLKGSPVCGANVTIMNNTYANCRNLTGSPACGSKVTDMHNAYYYCWNLTSNPACGANVTNMFNAYTHCWNLTGAPACGANVINMAGAYYSCSNMKGSPACGAKVNDMRNTYFNCVNLTGVPLCGANVVNMYQAYANCKKISGNGNCGTNVTNMYKAYANCYNLTGKPACGNKVTQMAYAYWNAKSLQGNAYIYSASITNADGAFGNKNYSTRLNIYVPSGSTTFSTFIATSNTNSITMQNMTWTQSGSCYYNTAYNIYIYPVSNVAASRATNGD